jgi:hypothetical protein
MVKFQITKEGLFACRGYDLVVTRKLFFLTHVNWQAQSDKDTVNLKNKIKILMSKVWFDRSYASIIDAGLHMLFTN